MRVLTIATVIVFAGLPISCGRNAIAAPQLDKPTAASAKPQLDKRIPPPDAEKYQRIRDARDWQNPYIVAVRDAVELTCKAASVERKKVRLDELTRELTALQVSGWPYGKVVGLQEASVGGGPNDSPLIRRNSVEAHRILRSLGIKVSMWPS